jgi:hypothetical protein
MKSLNNYIIVECVGTEKVGTGKGKIQQELTVPMEVSFSIKYPAGSIVYFFMRDASKIKDNLYAVKQHQLIAIEREGDTG